MSGLRRGARAHPKPVASHPGILTRGSPKTSQRDYPSRRFKDPGPTIGVEGPAGNSIGLQESSERRVIQPHAHPHQMQIPPGAETLGFSEPQAPTWRRAIVELISYRIVV